MQDYFDKNGKKIFNPPGYYGEMQNQDGHKVNRPVSIDVPEPRQGPERNTGIVGSLLILIFFVYIGWTNRGDLIVYMLLLHKFFRWGLIAIGSITILLSVFGVTKARSYTSADKTFSSIFLIICYAQAAIITLVYLSAPSSQLLLYGIKPDERGNIVFTLEYEIIMAVALICLQVGKIVVKNAGDPFIQHKRSLIFFGGSLLLILAAIPLTFLWHESFVK